MDEVIPSPQKSKWLIPLVLILLVGWILAGFFGYSYKKVKEESLNSTHTATESVTIHEPVEVAGKIVYRDVVKTNVVHDTVEVVKKETTIIRSGVSVGVAMSLTGDKAIWAAPDLFPIGPGNLQGMAFYDLSGKLYIGGAYRLNF